MNPDIGGGPMATGGGMPIVAGGDPIADGGGPILSAAGAPKFVVAGEDDTLVGWPGRKPGPLAPAGEGDWKLPRGGGWE